MYLYIVFVLLTHNIEQEELNVLLFLVGIRVNNYLSIIKFEGKNREY